MMSQHIVFDGVMLVIVWNAIPCIWMTDFHRQTKIQMKLTLMSKFKYEFVWMYFIVVLSIHICRLRLFFIWKLPNIGKAWRNFKKCTYLWNRMNIFRIRSNVFNEKIIQFSKKHLESVRERERERKVSFWICWTRNYSQEIRWNQYKYFSLSNK